MSVHESEGKIQVVQLRRVLLLFALVLGLSAVVSSLAPPPEERPAQPTDTGDAPAPRTQPTAPTARTIRVGVPPAGRRERAPATHPAAAGSRLALEVSVPEPGDVEIEELGLRQSSDTFDPARFDLLARPPGRYDVTFLPVRGEPRTVAHLEFEQPATVTPPRRAR